MSDTDPLPTLWLRLRAMFARASDSIGAPQTLARLGALSRRRRHEIGCWIARLECIARKLLFAQAARLEAQQIPPSQRRVCATRRQGATNANAAIDLARPETWPARFKLAPPRDPRAVPESRAPRIRALCGSPAPMSRTPARVTPQRAAASLRFAFRVEALRRVFDNPTPYARRLARIFHRLQRRFPEPAARYALITARPHAPDTGDPRLIIEAMMIAIAAAQLFLNSS